MFGKAQSCIFSRGSVGAQIFISYWILIIEFITVSNAGALWKRFNTTGNTCAIWLYIGTETRDSGWRAVTGYDWVRCGIVSGDCLIHCFTQKHRSKPLWSQVAFRLCVATGLPQDGKVQKCAFLPSSLPLCRVGKEVLETEQKVFPASSDGKQEVVEVYQLRFIKVYLGLLMAELLNHSSLCGLPSNREEQCWSSYISAKGQSSTARCGQGLTMLLFC